MVQYSQGRGRRSENERSTIVEGQRRTFLSCWFRRFPGRFALLMLVNHLIQQDERVNTRRRSEATAKAMGIPFDWGKQMARETNFSQLGEQFALRIFDDTHENRRLRLNPS